MILQSRFNRNEFTKYLFISLFNTCYMLAYPFPCFATCVIVITLFPNILVQSSVNGMLRICKCFKTGSNCVKPAINSIEARNHNLQNLIELIPRYKDWNLLLYL